MNSVLLSLKDFHRSTVISVCAHLKNLAQNPVIKKEKKKSLFLAAGGINVNTVCADMKKSHSEMHDRCTSIENSLIF